MGDRDLLTIGELADFVGVTVRTVRHYHQRGLLAEPDRDASGYRRYGAAHVVALTRIRTLADAGVPLRRVGELLDADEADFGAALEEIQQRLEHEITRLNDSRARVSRLAAGERLVLSPAVVAYLDRLRSLGMSEHYVALERDGWILLSARMPERIEEWIAIKQSGLDDPRYLETFRMLDECLDWRPDDARLDDVADRFDALLRIIAAETTGGDEIEPVAAGLLDDQVAGYSPAWDRLELLMQRRGWHGWSNITHE